MSPVPKGERWYNHTGHDDIAIRGDRKLQYMRWKRRRQDDKEIACDPRVFDLLKDKSHKSTIDIVEFSILQNLIDKLLGSLPKREENILRLRYGIGDGNARTLEEIGSIFDLSKGRVSQIEVRALHDLRQPARICELRPFIDREPSSPKERLRMLRNLDTKRAVTHDQRYISRITESAFGDTEEIRHNREIIIKLGYKEARNKGYFDTTPDGQPYLVTERTP